MTAPVPSDTLVAQVRARVLHDAWAQAWAATWERRATAFEDARPRRGDYTGRATPQQLRERWQTNTARAAACRARATGADGLVDRVLGDTLDDLTEGAA